jgi:hypothetical protein
MEDFNHLLVVVDPSSVHGEGSLSLARQALDSGGAVTVLVLLSGDEAAALRAFASAENVGLIAASKIYLRQIAERIGPEGVQTTSVLGEDPAGDLLSAIHDTGASALVIPASIAGRHVRALRRLTAEATVPVIIAPAGYAAAS